MSFTEAARTCFSKYATFSGRARRSEYWWFALLYLVVYLAGVLIASITDNTLVQSFGVLLLAAGALTMFLPLLAVTVRRLHDTGHSGWWYLLGLVPFGGIVILVFLAQDSSRVAHAYGPSPKELSAPALLPYA